MQEEITKIDSSRTQLLIGEKGACNLEKRSITIVGVGGVGGYVAYMLARAGVGKLKLVDFDRVAPSNLNRQIVANVDTIGKLKVEVLKEMLLKINPALKCEVVPQRLEHENVSQIITKCDMCVDAIDSVKDKVDLIVHCKNNNIPIISAMGAGNRFGVPRFYLTDIYKTRDDGLAKAVRKKLREAGVTKLEVVTSEEKGIPINGNIGSISYYPAMCGITIAAVVINKFLEEKND